MTETGQPLERLTVNLTMQAAEAREAAAARLGMLQTDVTCRALILYDAVDKALGEGRDVLIIAAGLPARRGWLPRRLRSRRLILNVATWRGPQNTDLPG